MLTEHPIAINSISGFNLHEFGFLSAIRATTVD